MARLGLGGECLKPTKGYHFSEGPYVEYEGELPPQYAAEPQALVAALNAEMGLLVEEGVETKVGGKMTCMANHVHANGHFLFD